MPTIKEHAHELIERLAPSQVDAVVRVIEAMLDPVSRAFANAPVDDEAETERERTAVAEAIEWFNNNPKGIPFEEMLTEFGVTPADGDGAKKQSHQASDCDVTT